MTVGWVLLFLFLYQNPAAFAKGIVNAHEHIQSQEELQRYREVSKQFGIEKTLVLGSPGETFQKTDSHVFEGYDQNNHEMLAAAKKFPKEFWVFPAIDTKDPQKLEKLKEYVKLGAKGLKLYSGHTYFYGQPLDDPAVAPVYQFCEANKLPILFHVNAGYYLEEFERVLKQYPKLRVICPHWCLSSIKEDRFRYLMDHYPNLYTDISFGHMPYLISALKRISESPGKFQKMVLDYQDRFFFGTDMVIAKERFKTDEWISRVFQTYKDLLEKTEYESFALPDETLKGLALDPAVLKKIYRENFLRFMENKK